MMNKTIVTLILAVAYCVAAQAQTFGGCFTTEGQYAVRGSANWVNLLRLDFSMPLAHGAGSVEAATIHAFKTHDPIVGDWQTFSNIETSNLAAAIAVLGYRHAWRNASLFVGVRNVNEDFFTSPLTSLFTNSSCGLFPTIAASYPIANYPFSSLTLYMDVGRAGWLFRNSVYNGVGHNGWNRHDNPFRLSPAHDGVFNISQLEYAWRGGRYYVGAAVHTRRFPVDDEGAIADADGSRSGVSCAWWAYGEQSLWREGGGDVSCMVQLSANTRKSSGCYRYGEVGCVYTDSSSACGLSAQYARFHQGREYSVEATWRRHIDHHIDVQPALQYITNDEGDHLVLSARLYIRF